MSKVWVGAFLVGLLALGAFGCATGVDSGSGRRGNSQPAAGAGPTVYDRDAGAETPDATGPQGMLDGAAFDPSTACTASSFEAEQVVVQQEVQVATQVETVKPTVLYVMLDKSLSMSWSNLWDPAVGAIESFIADDASSGLGVGLQYFPLNSGSCSTGAGYDTPVVDVGELPGNAQALRDSLDAQTPNGTGTPIEGALRGVTTFCEQYQSEHPDTQCVSVLVTDGKPEFAPGCTEDSNELAAIAADARDAGVTTFAVGLQGADFSLLDAIAQAGGAPDCQAADDARYACDVSSGADKLSDALASIRDTVVTTQVHTETVSKVEETTLPCQWQLPQAPQGQTLDFDKVNVRVSADTGTTTLFRVSDATQCSAGGWRYDDPESPTRLLACPQTCEQIDAASDAKIELLLGCATLGPQ